MTDEQQIRAAVAAVRSARQGIHTAADRLTGQFGEPVVGVDRGQGRALLAMANP